MERCGGEGWGRGAGAVVTRRSNPQKGGQAGITRRAVAAASASNASHRQGHHGVCGVR